MVPKQIQVTAFAVIQLGLCCLIWAALHDIARQKESSYLGEYSFLAAVPFLTALLWRAAFQILSRKARIVWTGAFAGWVLLVGIAAWDALAKGLSRTNGSFERIVITATAIVISGLVILAWGTARRHCARNDSSVHSSASVR